MVALSFPVEGGVWSFPCETPVPESVAVGVGLSGVSLTVGDGDCDGLDDWTGDDEAVGDEDREDEVVGDGDCEGDCVGVAVGVADLVGHAVGEAVAYGTIEVGIVGVARFPGPGAVVEAAFELEPPPVDTYCVDAGLGDAVG
jgi:hypothetical protein